MLEHGGRLRRAATDYGIPLADWLDLSTGLAPYVWPLPDIPAQIWQRLPEDDDGLEAAACAYYAASAALPVAGSQAAIQALPAVFAGRRVGIVEPCYAEHHRAWEAAGSTPLSLREVEVDARLEQIDVLLVVNPNNPTGRLFSVEQLLRWHAVLAGRGGYLIVDEAFMDPTPEHSLAPHSQLPGLVVLRSLGKFFGLGGARLGFVLAADSILHPLSEKLGPWTVSGPTRYVGQKALANRATQHAWRERLSNDAYRLATLLTVNGLAPAGGCALFQWVPHRFAVAMHDALARQGILVRLFSQHSALRIGLPAEEAGWQRLSAALSALTQGAEPCPR